MSAQTALAPPKNRIGRIVTIGLYLFYLSGVGRTVGDWLNMPAMRPTVGWILGLELVFLLLFTVVLLRPPSGTARLHLYFGIQSAIIVAILILMPWMDFVSSFFLLLSFQAAMLFTGRPRWAWIIGFAVLIAVPLMLFLGPLRGLALGLSPIAALFVIAAYVITSQEVETAQARSQAILRELQEAHQQLEAHAGQVEELAGIQERNRLARELHDSVSQTMFSIQLNARTAEVLLEKDPARVRPQLEQLQSLVQSALAEMRSLITELRLRNDGAADLDPGENS
jgi:signal transduction histidine kinase